jgi:uncharacterized zinc-type alcohol dehydrogenase-like protein
MEENIINKEQGTSRRKFIQQSAALSSAIMLAGPIEMLADSERDSVFLKNVTAKGYAAKDNSGKLTAWSFERRAVGDNDIIIEIRYSGICHSDIHQMKGDWGGIPETQEVIDYARKIRSILKYK